MEDIKVVKKALKLQWPEEETGNSRDKHTNGQKGGNLVNLLLKLIRLGMAFWIKEALF